MINKLYPFYQMQPHFTFIINLCFISAPKEVQSQQISLTQLYPEAKVRKFTFVISLGENE